MFLLLQLDSLFRCVHWKRTDKKGVVHSIVKVLVLTVVAIHEILRRNPSFTKMYGISASDDDKKNWQNYYFTTERSSEFPSVKNRNKLVDF